MPGRRLLRLARHSSCPAGARVAGPWAAGCEACLASASSCCRRCAGCDAAGRRVEDRKGESPRQGQEARRLVMRVPGGAGHWRRGYREVARVAVLGFWPRARTQTRRKGANSTIARRSDVRLAAPGPSPAKNRGTREVRAHGPFPAPERGQDPGIAVHGLVMCPSAALRMQPHLVDRQETRRGFRWHWAIIGCAAGRGCATFNWLFRLRFVGS